MLQLLTSEHCLESLPRLKLNGQCWALSSESTSPSPLPWCRGDVR